MDANGHECWQGKNAGNGPNPTADEDLGNNREWTRMDTNMKTIWP
jgi:hypothetical protein